MHQPFLVLALTLLAQADPAAPPKGELVPEPPPGFRVEYATDAENPPAGTAEELKLWKAGIDALPRVTLVRRQSVLVRASAKGQDLGNKLRALRAKAGHEASERMEEAGRRLEAAWVENVEIYTRQWPVDPTRVCGYQLMNYDSALRLPPGPSRQAEVTNATEPLATCVRQAGGAADRMDASNRRLSEATAEAAKVVSAAEAHARHEAHEEAERRERKGGEGN